MPVNDDYDDNDNGDDGLNSSVPDHIFANFHKHNAWKYFYKGVLRLQN